MNRGKRRRRTKLRSRKNGKIHEVDDIILRRFYLPWRRGGGKLCLYIAGKCALDYFYYYVNSALKCRQSWNFFIPSSPQKLLVWILFEWRSVCHFSNLPLTINMSPFHRFVIIMKMFLLFFYVDKYYHEPNANWIFSLCSLFTVYGPQLPEQPTSTEPGLDRPVFCGISFNRSHIRTGHMEVSTTTFITLTYSSAEGEELHLHTGWYKMCNRERTR